ncbi:MAG TPA: SagB/ThcOx family dehydrogenase [Bryobacteraceae bacterium]|nr:SagB/ThcOx family dehydrogenase [Bryobacteraceae bacterium]
MLRTIIGLMVFSLAPLAAADVQLPAPRTDGGKPLMQALKLRKSVREFSSEKLSPQQLSNLLWAAFGINRADGRRTAPSAMNWQEIDLYVTTADAVYVYEAKDHRLREVLAGDQRGLAGTQAFVKDAPLNIVYVADTAKTQRANADDQNLYTGADAGFIAQNVYLFCASEGLGTVARGSIDRAAFAKALKLRPEQKVILAQTVGYTK